MNYIKLLEKEQKNISDLIIKTIEITNNTINIISIETITDTSNINDFILYKISFLPNINKINLTSYLFNHLPVNSISLIDNYETLLNRLFNGFVIVIINNQDILAIEMRNNLTRGITEANYEKNILGPKDSFNENYNTNLGLIRRRIKSNKLYIKNYELGKYTKTKIGLIYLKDLTKSDLIKRIDLKLNSIKIDGIVDANYLKKYLSYHHSLFPSVKITERPDLATLSLLEGKAIIIVDNSPVVLILPTFFIDYFHMSDDYYQKQINISFIRFIRLIAFIIAIFLPGIYVSLTTHNPDNMPINLLLSFQTQRQFVPFPAFLEAIFMIIIFEILRETDIRIPSAMGSAISILGGLVLGEAAVSAGIVSPIMIIVIAISAISGMIISNIEVINSIRWYRFILIILASFFGFYGIFLGCIAILTNLADTKSLNKDYLYPFAPINIEEQKDGFFRLPKKPYRNPLLTNNKKRGQI